MAWGALNKIKKGLKKFAGAVKKGVKFLNEKMVQPFRPLIRQVANRYMPGAGEVVDGVADAINVVDQLANGNTNIRLRQ